MTEIEWTPELIAAYNALGSENVFVTGQAGCGKSTLLHKFEEDAHGGVAVVAPTGIAALNVGGSTIHKFFGFGINITPDDAFYKEPRNPELLKRLKTLVIDEASMVRADLFDCIESNLTQFGPEPGKAFGGVKIALFGDPYQLGPVAKTEDMRALKDYHTLYFWGARAYQRTEFRTIELTRPFRQTDPEFLEILNSIRTGEAKSALIDKLQYYVLRYMDYRDIKNSETVMLCTHNKQAAHVNHQILLTLDTEEKVFEAEIEGHFPMSNLPADENLALRIGARVMIVRNGEGYVNGTLAVVQEFGKNGNVVVELPDGNTASIEPATWESYEYTSSALGGIRKVPVGSFTQLPIKLGYAVTIHKAQGVTLDSAILNLDKEVFAPGQAYVALSRLRTVDGLTITPRPLYRQDVKVDPQVLKFMKD